MNDHALDPSTTTFGALVAVVDGFPWRPEVLVERVPAPQQVAPRAHALAADVVVAGEDVGSGRLVLLHDPQGNPSWRGRDRLVSFVRADVELAMATDPLLTQVGWSWLQEALEGHGARHVASGGTVTQVVSHGFGELAADEGRGELEIRSSWTPVLDDAQDLSGHLAAWQELLCTVAGLPPMAPGLVRIGKGRTR